jgi:hypothetical protein
VVDVELAEPVGEAPRVVGGEAVGGETVGELEVEVAPEERVEHVGTAHRGTGLVLERHERGQDAGPGVDQRHVEIESHDRRHRADPISGSCISGSLSPDPA